MAFQPRTDKNQEEVKTNKDAKLEIRGILDALDKVIDDRGRLKDNASPELQSIRRQLVSQENDLRKKLDSILRNARSNGWVSDDFSLTLRNGRMVIPLAAEHKRKIKGFIHDESDTGKTVFLEPTEVLEANNEIRELESAERREIIRILMDLTTRLRPHVPVLKRAYTFLGIIDFVRESLLCYRARCYCAFKRQYTISRLEKCTSPIALCFFQENG
jgi:DNA mismatch repair protein MutS2